MSTRIKSAAVALVLAIVAIILHKTIVLNLLMAFISAMAVYEVLKATGAIKFKAQSIACCAFAAVDAIVPYFLYRVHTLYFFSYRLYFGIFILVMCLLYLRDHKNFMFSDFFGMAGAAVLISYPFGCLISMAQSMEPNGNFPFLVGKVTDDNIGKVQVFIVVLTLCGAWLADSGAYFVGTYFSKSGRKVHHPWPEISPKKTIEGLAGGVVVNGLLMLLVSGVFDLITKDIHLHYVIIFFAGMACALIGLVGDLTASMIKRQTGIKDYGNIMPGHGGVMDRFDSVLLVAPFMYYLLSQGLIIK